LSVKALVPWRAKIGAKIVLSRLPLGPRAWQRLSLFQQGRMDDPAYALEVFSRHFARFEAVGPADGFSVLELGPGDTVSSALIAHAHGASRSYLVDTAPFAIRDLAPYADLAEILAKRGLRVPELGAVETFDEFLSACGATYETDGLASLRAIPDDSVDFAWSHAVLEHVRRADFLETLRELRRILRPGGISSHCVDLRDHLGEALNNLRFSERVWESRLMADSGFYTNRIRYSEMLELFRRAGFEPDVVLLARWPRLPTPKAKLSSPFASLSHEELRVSGFDVVLRSA
jgi:SAM-dependent methyltransferase